MGSAVRQVCSDLAHARDVARSEARQEREEARLELATAREALSELSEQKAIRQRHLWSKPSAWQAPPTRSCSSRSPVRNSASESRSTALEDGFGSRSSAEAWKQASRGHVSSPLENASRGSWWGWQPA